ncbi:MAG: CopG family antitoxin [Chloroflexota bacterium]
MSEIPTPEFKTYEEEAEFWDNFDTADYMDDDGEWFQFVRHADQAVQVAILPQVAEPLRMQAQAQGVSFETLINVLLAQHIKFNQTTSNA